MTVTSANNQQECRVLTDVIAERQIKIVSNIKDGDTPFGMVGL